MTLAKETRRLNDRQRGYVEELKAKYPRLLPILVCNNRSTYMGAKNSGFTDDDIESACWYGATIAAYKFRPELNVQFNTYAYQWIRSTVQDLYERLQTIKRGKGVLIVPGDKTTGDANEISFWDRYGLLDERNLPPLDQLLIQEMKQLVAAVMKKIHKRNRDIVCYRLGIADGERKTLDQTAKRFKLSRERVRQIEAKTLQKIHNDLKAIYLDYCTKSEAQWTKPN